MTNPKEITEAINKIVFLNPRIAKKETEEIIAGALKKAFEEGVEQTIIAMNKKTFVKPKYNEH